MARQRAFVVVSLGLVTLAFLAGCPSGPGTGDDGGDGSLPPGHVWFDAGNLDGGVNSLVRVLNAERGSPALDVSLSGVASPVGSNVAFAGVSGYLSVLPGLYDVTAKNHANGQVLVTVPKVRLSSGLRYTLVAAGVIGSLDPANSFRVIPVAETFFPTSDGSARILFVHAVEDGVPLSVDLNGDGNLEEQHIDRFLASEGEGLEVSAAAATVVFGWAPDGGAISGFTTPALASHANYVFVLAGHQGVPPEDATGLTLVGADATGNLFQADPLPQLFAVHAIPDVPSVDLFRGTKKVVDGLPFSAVSSPLFLPTAGASLALYAHTDGGALPSSGLLATLNTGALTAKTRVLGVLAGERSGTKALALDVVTPGFTAAGTGEARFRGFNAVPDVASIDFGKVSGTSTFATIAGLTAVAYGSASSSTGAPVTPTGTVQLGLARNGQSTLLHGFALDVPAGGEAFLVALGYAQVPGGGGQPLGMLRVDVPTASVAWTGTAAVP